MKTELKIHAPDGLTRPFLIAGPCSAESETQVLTTARAIAEINKAIIFRAGIWKPRTRPNSFEGMGAPALDWMGKVKAETGLRTATEVANAHHAEECLKHGIDVLWIGARTTVNPFSVQEIADALKGCSVTVLVKNPVTPDLQLWLGALERVSRAGISRLAAVHRGFHPSGLIPFRNDPMWELVIELRTCVPDLPVICDPSHICGSTELIPYIAQKALDLDMHGLMIETHCLPSSALSDAKQQITPGRLKRLLGTLVYRSSKPPDAAGMDELEQLREAIDKTDHSLMQLLLNRMLIAERIGNYKKENGMTILQAERWNNLLRDRTDNASLMGLNGEFIRAVFQLIHRESVRRQADAMHVQSEELTC